MSDVVVEQSVAPGPTGPRKWSGYCYVCGWRSRDSLSWTMADIDTRHHLESNHPNHEVLPLF